MNYIPWSLVKLLHEERVDKALRAACVEAAFRASRPERKFRLFANRRTRASGGSSSPKRNSQTTKAS
jgi:hypothetical protein